MRRSLKILLIIVISMACFSLGYAAQLDTVRASFAAGDYTGCIVQAEKAIAAASSKKGLDEVYYLLGLSYLKVNNHLRASDVFDIILAEYKDSRFRQEAMLGLGDSYFLKGDLDKAGRAYQDLVSQYPATRLKAGIYYRLAQLGRRIGNAAQEKEYRDKLKKEFPASPEAMTTKELFPPSAISGAQIAPPAAGQKAEPAVVSSAASPAPAAGGYCVQVGAFASRTNADRLSRTLEGKGFESFVVEGFAAGKKVYKVRVGMFADAEAAARAENRLRQQGYPTKIVP